MHFFHRLPISMTFPPHFHTCISLFHQLFPSLFSTSQPNSLRFPGLLSAYLIVFCIASSSTQHKWFSDMTSQPCWSYDPRRPLITKSNETPGFDVRWRLIIYIIEFAMAETYVPFGPSRLIVLPRENWEELRPNQQVLMDFECEDSSQNFWRWRRGDIL